MQHDQHKLPNHQSKALASNSTQTLTFESILERRNEEINKNQASFNLIDLKET
jgi:hypothetical protein